MFVAPLQTFARRPVSLIIWLALTSGQVGVAESPELVSRLTALGYEPSIAARLATRYPELATLSGVDARDGRRLSNAECLAPIILYRGLSCAPSDYQPRWKPLHTKQQASPLDYYDHREIWASPDLDIAFPYALTEEPEGKPESFPWRTVIEYMVPRCLFVAPTTGRVMDTRAPSGVFSPGFTGDERPFIHRMGILDLRNFREPFSLVEVGPERLRWLSFSEVFDAHGNYIGPQ